jgi:hypothetical protein
MERKKIIVILIIVAILIVLLVIANLLYPISSNGVINEEFPETQNGNNVTTIANGTFQNGNYDVEGTALMLDVDGDLILRFEDFKSEDGPGLYVYLSVDQGDNDFVDLGKLEGIEGNMNYNVPSGTNIAKYNYVLIWCEPYSVLFGYAILV